MMELMFMLSRLINKPGEVGSGKRGGVGKGRMQITLVF